MRMLSLTVTAQTAGKKVRQLLRGELHISSTLLKSLKWRRGAILLNGRPVTVAEVTHEGDVLTVNVTDEGALSPHILPVDYPLAVLWEDEDLLIINKSAGLAVHSAALTAETVTVAGAVAHYLGSTTAFHPVNRLDRGVTGIMAVAKNGHMHQRCMALLHTEDFCREYRGVTQGIPAPLCQRQ